MNTPLTYPDDDECEVCEFDLVAFKAEDAGSLPGQGTVAKIYPRKKTVRIRYEDPNWRHKPTYKTEIIPLENITLIQRDG